MEIRTPNTQEEWEVYYDLRYRVLREPLGKKRGSEKNEGDETGTHLALFDGNTILAIARLDFVENSVYQARFVAVEHNQQGKGLGKKIMLALEEKAKEKGGKKVILHARDYALAFYEGLNYTLVGPSYKLFDVLQHFEMFKNL